MRTGRLVSTYAGAMITLTMLYFALHHTLQRGALVAVGLIGVVSAGAVGYGVRRFRPRRATSWLLLAAALVLDAVGRIVYDLLPGEAGTLKPGTWAVWLIYAAMLACLGMGGLGLARSRVRGTSLAIDAAIILLGAGLLFGVLIAAPYAGAADIGTLWAVARIAYVARDVLVLALAGYLATVIRWNASLVSLLTGLVGFVTHDVLFRLGRIRGEWLSGTAIDIAWLLFFAGIGLAALVPSMLGFDRPVPLNGEYRLGEDWSTRIRLGIVMIAALTPSVALVIQLFEPPVWYQGAVVVIATLILILTLARILDVAAQLRDQVRGERIIRGAVADLADAHDDAEVEALLDRIIGRLLRPDTDYRIALTTLPRSSFEPGWLETDRLPSSLATRLGGRGQTLVVDADAPPRPRTGPSAVAVSSGAITGERSTLLVRADRSEVDRLRPRLETLATQTGLARERLRLAAAIIQHTSETYFRTLVQKSADVILIVDDDNKIRYASPSAAGVFGSVPLPGAPLLGQIEAGSRPAVVATLDQARSGAGRTPVPSCENWTVLSEAGVPVEVEVSCEDLRSDPSINGLVLTLRNVTEQRRLERELEQSALHDALTGLSNRLMFTRELDAAMHRQATDRSRIGVLYIDLDDLKAINEGLGHEAGDAVLAAVAERLRAFVASQHALGVPVQAPARLGGDEFAVMLTGLTKQRPLHVAADTLVEVLAQPVQVGESQVSCGVSIGVATTADASTEQELLGNADLALYAAKGTGKGQWRRYEPWMRTMLMTRLDLLSSLEQALDRDEFFLEYQPIVALHNGETVGFEALLRWQHPTQGRLAPDAFIEVAEQSGLIMSIGQWILSTAFAQARQWAEMPGCENCYVAINISPRQPRSRNFVATFKRLLAESGLRADRVVLEITESLLMREDDRLWLDLQNLRHMGVRIAIDDFGTGYSALSYLRQVPLDVVKLDRSFVRSMPGSAKQRELVKGIVGLARILELPVIAEGIETEAEYSAAFESGCAYGQGFLFSQPLSEAEIPRWARQRQRADQPMERLPSSRSGSGAEPEVSDISD